jgi:hypothetical protein
MLSIKNSSMVMISVSEDYLVNITYAKIKTQDKQNKTTKQYVLDTTMRKANTNNVNNTRTLIQKTGVKSKLFWQSVGNVKFLRYMAYVSVLYRNIWSHS